MMRILALIHARGGSKRIPLKNIQIVGGKPLLAYPIQLAKSIKSIDRVIVSTDHPKIIKIAQEYGADVPFVRPADLSEDVPSEMVTEHALKFCIEKESYIPDICITLTPATPFTDRENIIQGLKLLNAHPEWDSVVTIRKAKEFPQWMIDIEPDGTCKTLLGNPLDGEYNISQNLKKYFFPLGAYFINRVKPFLQFPSMYGKTWGAIKLSEEVHLDIDEAEDLERARKLFESRKRKNE